MEQPRHKLLRICCSEPPDGRADWTIRLLTSEVKKRSNGSWLNVAEIELSILSKQCLKRRIDRKSQLKDELLAWQQERNHMNCKVSWQFSTLDTRVKLKHLYPVFEEDNSSAIEAVN